MRALERVAQEVRGEVACTPATHGRPRRPARPAGEPPRERRSLPLALSVGRLAPVKGMAALVSCWLSDAALRRWCNLLVVGGDLDDPSPEEAAELARIREGLAATRTAAPACCSPATAPTPRRRRGWPPPGAAPPARPASPARQPPVSTCAPASRRSSASPSSRRWPWGWSSWPPAAVAPRPTSTTASPASTDPSHREDLAGDIGRALDLAAAPAALLGSHRSRAVVRERFGIDTMAAALGASTCTRPPGTSTSPGRWRPSP